MRIRKYTIDKDIDGDDILLGSDVAHPGIPTRNYKIKDIQEYILAKRSLTGLSYRYYANEEGEHTLNKRGAIFTDSPFLKHITKIFISRYAENGNDHSLMLNTFIDKQVVIKISNEQSPKYGFYKALSFTKEPVNQYYAIDVEVVDDMAYGEMQDQELFLIGIDPALDAIVDTRFDSDIAVMLSGNKSLGQFINGDTIPANGKTIQEVMRLIAQESVAPTMVPFSFSGSAPTPVEVGTSFHLISLSFNRGVYKGKLVNGVWEPNTEQGKVLGEATKFTIDGVDNGLATSRTINKLTTLGSNSILAKVDYAEGHQATDSTGANFGTKESAGELTATVSWSGFYYRTAIAGNTMPTATQVRSATVKRNSAGTLRLPTGTTNTRFDVFVEDGKALTKANDENNLNNDITAEFILQSGFFVGKDANGDNVNYKHYVRQIDNPYNKDTQGDLVLIVT